MTAPRIGRTVLMLFALVLGACGRGGPLMGSSDAAVQGLPTVELEVSREFVLASVQRSEAASYTFAARLSMLMDMGFMRMELPGEAPLITGMFDGTRTSMTADVGAMMEELADSNDEFAAAFTSMESMRDQLIIDLVVDDTTMYLHAPMFGVPGMDATGAGADLSAVVDGWGSVDLTRVSDLGVGDLTSLGGAGGMDPSTMLTMLQDIATDVREDGRERVNGANTTRLIGHLAIGDLLEAQDDLASSFGDMGAPADADMWEMLTDTTVEIVVNIDDHGLVRRVSYELDMGAMLADVGASQGVGLEMMGEIEMRVGIVVDFADYGHTNVVAVPIGAVDITNQLIGGFRAT